MVRGDVQRLSQLLGPYALPNRSDPSQPIQVCDREGLRPVLQICQQGVSAPGVDPGVTQVVGKKPGTGLDLGRFGEEVGGLNSGWQGPFLPCHFIEKFVDAFDRGEERRPRGPLDGIVAQSTDPDSVRIIDAELSALDLRRTARLRRLLRRFHAHVAEHSFREVSR